MRRQVRSAPSGPRRPQRGERDYPRGASAVTPIVAPSQPELRRLLVSQFDAGSSIDEVRGDLNGQVIAPDDPGYDDARSVFYPKWDARPALIIRPADAGEVAYAVSLARDSGVELPSERRPQRRGPQRQRRRVVLDLALMKAVEIDPDARTAWVDAERPAASRPHERASSFWMRGSGAGVAHPLRQRLPALVGERVVGALARAAGLLARVEVAELRQALRLGVPLARGGVQYTRPLSAIRRRSCGPAPLRPTRTRIANENGLRRSGVDMTPIRSYRSNSDTESTPKELAMTAHDRPDRIPELNFLGVRARVLAEGSARCSTRPPARSAAARPPPHDEGFYVLSGEVTLVHAAASR